MKKQLKRTKLNHKPHEYHLSSCSSHEERQLHTRLYHSVFLKDNNLQSFRWTDIEPKTISQSFFTLKYFCSLINAAWVLEGLRRNLILRRRHEFINSPAKISGLSLMVQKDNCIEMNLKPPIQRKVLL